MSSERSPATVLFDELRASAVVDNREWSPRVVENGKNLPRLTIDPILEEARIDVSHFVIGATSSRESEDTCVVSDATIPRGLSREALEYCAEILRGHMRSIELEFASLHAHLQMLQNNESYRNEFQQELPTTRWILGWFRKRKAKVNEEEFQYFHAMARFLFALEEALKPFKSDRNIPLQSLQEALWAARRAENLLSAILDMRASVHRIIYDMPELAEE